MTHRFFPRLFPSLFSTLTGCIAAMLLIAASLLPLSAHAQGIEIKRASIESTDDGYRLSTDISFELTRGLEDVITRGIPLYFTTEAELTQPRWYWFNEKAITTSRTIRISYDVLTRQYHVSLGGLLHQSFGSLDDALSLVKRPARWIIADKGTLNPGSVYRVRVRMGLDVARLPKPIQIHALNSSDWRFSSDWIHFSFRAE